MSAPSSQPATGVEAYLRLLLAYHALPQIKTSQTFMEVSGYPSNSIVLSLPDKKEFVLTKNRFTLYK
jgi:hypothetical protein